MRQLWTRAAVIALTAGTLAACETTAPQYPSRDGSGTGSPSRVPTPNFPVVQEPAPIDTAPQPSEIVRPEPMTPQPEAAPPPASVQSQPLAPLTPAEPPPPPPPPPVAIRPAAPIIVTTVGGPVVEVAGKPKVHVVKSGDALDAIARGLGTTRADLAKDNGLEPPYRIKPGQELKGPATKGKAYVVQSGDTLFAVARRFTVSAAALAEENDLKAGAAIKKGQRLRLPASYKDKGPTKTAMAPPPSSTRSTATLAGAAPGRTVETPRATAPVMSQPASTPTTPATVTTTTTSVTGAVVNVAGPRQVHTVKSGDTLTAIARRFDMSVKDLAAANDLDADKPLRLGARLNGPATTAKAYTVQSGDTLTAIAKRFGVTLKALADENDLKTGAAVKKGQKVRLPDGYKDKGPIKTTTTRPAAPSTTFTQAPTPAAPTVSTPTPAPARAEAPAITPSAPIPYRPSASTPRPSGPVAAMPVLPTPTRPIIESSAAPTEAEIIASGRGRFSWPLRGEVISTFGIKGSGQRNDGLNIRANAGAPVVSAADGEIAYAGNQVPTFGNLVLVKHADGWVTAYAHLGTTDVKMRQQVSKGQQLGTVGATGGVNEPQLHFEMRFAPTVKDKARPVDPALVLPR